MEILGSNFCVAPFSQLTLNPLGDYSPCAEIGGRPWKDPTTSPLTMWSSKEFESLRDSFKSNEKNSICNRCWDQEKTKNQSLRKRLFVGPKMFETGEALSFANDTYKNGPKQINIITGNNCNLRCRICSASSSWTYNIEGRAYESIIGKKTLYTSDTPKPIQLTDQQLDEIYKLSSNLQRIEFYGGEPLLDDRTLTLLKKYIDDGTSKNISLMYNTNGQNLPSKKHFEYWPHFSSIDFNISIDDINERYTYNRHPGKWADLVNVVKTIKSNTGNFVFFSICTVSILNVFYLPEILDELDRMNLKCFINHVFGPKYYDILHLPMPIKSAIKDKLSKYKDQKRIEFIMNMLNSPEDLEIWEEFKFWTSTKDQYRNESFSKTYPEFYKVIKDYDSSM